MSTLELNRKMRDFRVKHAAAFENVIDYQLRDGRVRFQKRADIGGTPSNSFEQSFANLAHSYINENAAKLMPYHVGFQLLEKSRENDKAVGIFGFKVGDEWLFVPTFFLNGELKGHELLYSQNQDLFMPLKDSWVNYILGRKPGQFGEQINRINTRDRTRSPDFYRLKYPPTKYGSADAPRVAGWAQPGLDAVADAVLTNVYTDPRLADRTTFMDAVKAAGDEGVAYVRGVREYWPVVYKQAQTLYGPELDSIANGSILTKAAHTVQPVRARGGSLMSGLIRPIEKRSAVTVFLRQEYGTIEELDKLQDPVRRGLLQSGRFIEDRRSDQQVSKLYDVETPLSLGGPDVNGLYEVLVKPGKLETCAIFMNPFGGNGRCDFATVLSTSSPTRWTNAHITQIAVRHGAMPEKFQKWLESHSGIKSFPKGPRDPDDMNWDTKYMIFNGRGEATTPFRIREELTIGGGNDERLIAVSFDDYPRSSNNLWENDGPSLRGWPSARMGRGKRMDVPYGEIDRIRLLPDRRSSTFMTAAKELYVTGDSHWMKLTEGRDKHAIDLGDAADVQAALTNVGRRLELFSQGSDVKVNGKSMDKESAFKELVVNWNLRPDVADVAVERCLRSDSRNRLFRYVVKEAAEPPLYRPGPGAPNFPDIDDDAGENWHPNIQSKTTGISKQISEGLRPDSSAFERHSPLRPLKPDHETMMAAQQAAQSGSSEVFDGSMLSGLLRTVSKGPMVRRLIPNLLKGQDSLGRILLQMYWHGDQFAEMYPKSELPEMEDGVRNTFESLGDVILKLKTTSPAVFDVDGIHVDLEPVADQ